MLSDETFTIDITGASRMGTYNNYDSDDKVKGYVIIGEPEALSDGISVPIRVLSTRIKVFINYAGNLIVKNEPRCRLFDLPDIEEEKNVITSGDINFVPGYNCEIKVIDNTITLIPVIGAGKGIMTAIDNGEGQPIDLPISEAEKQYFADNLTGKTYYAGIQNSGSGYLMSLNGAAGANIFIDGLSKINVSNFNPLDPTLSQNTVLIQAVNLAKC
ncbi:hypothetical protein FACS189427_10810 [Planctomycetales bacterium]|nr:hypothetical protein FACS189427_10810 [Planctomycetales bacterium]